MGTKLWVVVAVLAAVAVLAVGAGVFDSAEAETGDETFDQRLVLGMLATDRPETPDEVALREASEAWEAADIDDYDIAGTYAAFGRRYAWELSVEDGVVVASESRCDPPEEGVPCPAFDPTFLTVPGLFALMAERLREVPLVHVPGACEPYFDVSFGASPALVDVSYGGGPCTADTDVHITVDSFQGP